MVLREKERERERQVVDNNNNVSLSCGGFVKLERANWQLQQSN